MKNNLFKFILISFFFTKLALAENFTFQTSKIKLIDKDNLIIATDGTAYSKNKDLEIKDKKFEYNKNSDLLKAFNGIAYFKKENLEIEFDEIISNQVTLITTAKNNVKIKDINKQLIIETDLINFNKNLNILESPTNSILKDKTDNTLKSSNFSYNLNDGILKLEKAVFRDINDNNFEIDLAYLNTVSNQLIGKDIVVNLNNKSFNKDNEPRIKGRSIIYQNEITEVTKGVFTTCKKRDKCPPWQLSAKKVNHNPKKQTINYKDAVLRVYNVPVLYFPRFFHPDPTVKRQSGFLTPTIKNSPNSDNFLSLPYFSVISLNKDMTFTPRFYTDDKLLVQTEYREVNKDSNHFSDFSLFKEKNKGSKSHFFYNYNKIIDIAQFTDGNLNFKVERTSNDTYLRGNKLKSPIIKDYSVLQNSFGLDLYSDDLSINSELKIYENLDMANSHDRYEFVLPRINLVKRFNNRSDLDGSFLLKSNNFIRSYKTNILEKVNINNLIFNSNPKISNFGFKNNYDFLFKNVNSNTQNSSKFEEDDNFYFSGIFQLNSSLPLIKEDENYLRILKPKMALKMSPNHTKDLSKSDGNRLDVNNIYNIDRLAVNETVEGGASLTFGNDFSIFSEEKSKELFSLKIANNLRLDVNDDLPKKNQLGSKTSNFFGEIALNPTNFFKTKYNISTRNNLTSLNYENLTAEFNINNFVTTFDYLNENNSIDKKSYLTNTTKFLFDDSNSIQFSTRENKSSNLTEYYNLIYEYKNDCLVASVEYNKDYYNDRDIKPEENIFLKLTIIPFGQTSSPNLKD